MKGQGYLCNYYKPWKQEHYCNVLVKKFMINDVDDINRCRKLITLATGYATKEQFASNDRDRSTYLYRISYVDGLLREHIRNVGRVHVEKRG